MFRKEFTISYKHMEWTIEDEFGRYTVPFDVHKTFSFKHGFNYCVKVSDFTCNDKNLLTAIGMAVEHLYHDAPAYYRLKEQLPRIKKEVQFELDEHFYEIPSTGELFIGRRAANFYYGSVDWMPRYEKGSRVSCTMRMSRHLPWGELFNGFQYREEPKRIPFERWLEKWMIQKGFVKEEIDD